MLEILAQKVKEKDRLNEEIKELIAKIIEDRIKHKIGDIIPCEGYSYTGKPVKITAITGKIATRWYGDRATYIDVTIHGNLIKKDGSESSSKVNWSANIKNGLEIHFQ